MIVLSSRWKAMIKMWPRVRNELGSYMAALFLVREHYQIRDANIPRYKYIVYWLSRPYP